MVSVFGSSRPRPGDPDYQTAYELGKMLAASGYTVCNGGYGGIMEASARGAREAGGTSIGVVTEFFSRKANPYIDQTIVEATIVDRLQKLLQLGDAYVILKGGTGTLLELAALWEFMNKGIMPQKPAIAVGDFWMPIVDRIAQALVREGSERAARYVTVVGSPSECIATLNAFFGNKGPTIAV
ncbi:MAG: hypothetical protein AUI33_18150 [Ignavibacteria bacterium 13_1_40CM_2_61_4]|nr:MAG: hypothetical protein AUI33_18150 [Ignavibacteria bacterium 13_1_40CM_2_61_4]